MLGFLLSRLRLFHPPRSTLALLAGCFAFSALAEESEEAKTEEATAHRPLNPVIVTVPPSVDPLTVVMDTKAPRQPVPAHDGADYLKTIPGFSLIRKGGSDADPVFRGMAGSRLNILSDGEAILGGCGGRMDPPTAYIFPSAYDRVTLLKGPQSVAWGPSSAGTVLFERHFAPYKAPDYRVFSSLMFGSFGRADQVLDAEMGDAGYYARLIGTRSSMDDYKDGDGRRVHSSYMRWSLGAALGFTPDETTRLEMATNVSDGKAAYADRMMDGAKFARQNVSLKFEKKKLSSLFEKLDAHAYYNYVDHVMDNYSLREQPGAKQVSNPDRRTVGMRLASELNLSSLSQLKLGADTQSNWHRFRAGNNLDYAMKRRTDDASFANHGLFAEWTQSLATSHWLVAGLRSDFWRAKDKRENVSTSGETRRQVLPGGFVRYERDFGGEETPSTLFAGIGHSRRAPDFWETISQSKQSETRDSAFHTKPEKNTQMDVGTLWQLNPRLQLSASAFFSWMRDYILIDNTRVLKPASLVRNIQATVYGGEAGLGYALTPHWKSHASLAYARGNNRTEHLPLAQMAPLDSRFALDYDDGTWLFGALLRLVASQNRFDKGKGNIAGQDIGRTPGFGVFSLNGGWRLRKHLLLAVGVDNLFNKTYAEALSRAGSMVQGYEQTARINEPGRYFWMKLDLKI